MKYTQMAVFASFAVAAICCAAAPQSPLVPDDDPELSAERMITPETDRSVDRGLRWLASRQHPDGSFGSGAYDGNVAVTALAGMAFMSQGSTPGRGPCGEQINRCIDYILDNAQPTGFISAPGTASHGPMYGHGFATLFLAECHGMSRRPKLREKLAKAVELILGTQNKQGGWRYYPERADADVSVTVCQVMALRAARNAGLVVGEKTIPQCIDYIKQSQNADGGFMYTLEGGESDFSRSAAGVVALQSAGVYKGPELAKGIAYVEQFRPQQGVVRREAYYYYGHYYAAQAMWHTGGRSWQQWYPAIRDELIGRQQKSGAWMSTYSAEYATAMACIVLQLPENYLPIFQR